ncbi:MAG: Gfo/Idh/MocA family oxidoreductase [Fimbriimonadaceae bacterium]|nr:Gfo/Idh/MocA family oxidoreductase [Fimbriimonadaceae bacterium]
MLKMAVYGLKHGHVQSILADALALPNVELVAVADDEARYREPLAARFGIPVRAATGQQIVDGEEFDIFVCADAYGQRGDLLERALAKGCHLLGDKPLCTDPAQAARIATALTAGGWAASLMLTFRYSALLNELRRRLAAGWLGALRTFHAFGPHHLAWGSRPDWYFTPRLHGGILNDLQCHGLDCARWLSGENLEQVLYAAVGNVNCPQAPTFEDNGQHLALFTGGLRFGGEVSYLTPPGGRSIGWLLVGWAERGQFIMDTHEQRILVDVAGEGTTELREVPPLPHPSPLRDLVNYLETGESPILTTAEVLASSQQILAVQAAAEWVA